MGGGSVGRAPWPDAPPPVAALLRRPSVWVRHRVLDAVHAAGFPDVLPAHLGVFQYPGPDGVRPGVLAMRTQSSKQAMNHLLHQLEVGGYLRREGHPQDRRTRVVRLTDRGWEVLEVIGATTEAIEGAWQTVLGDKVYDDLRHGLFRLEAILDATELP